MLWVCHDTKQFLSQNFKMKDLGEASYAIGIEIRSQRTLGLSHKAYIEKVLEKFRMGDCSPNAALYHILLSLLVIMLSYIMHHNPTLSGALITWTEDNGEPICEGLYGPLDGK